MRVHKILSTICNSILGFALLIPAVCFATNPSLQSPDLLHYNVKSKKNLMSNFVYYAQDPYPFCYSVTSNMLIDFKMCELNPSLCNKRSSFLETSVLGVAGKKDSQKVSTDGGSYNRVIEVVKKRGYLVTNDSCNYSHVTDNGSWFTGVAFNRKIEELKSFHARFHKYKDYSPYFKAYASRKFKHLLAEIKISEDQALEILTEPDFDKVFYAITFNPNCAKPVKYKIPTNFQLIMWESQKQDLVEIENETKKKVADLLHSKKIVGVTFCLQEKINTLTGANQCKTRHSLVISGIAELEEKSTKQKKIAYYVGNTWGEVWQAKTGGLVWADDLHQHMFNTISWLE